MTGLPQTCLILFLRVDQHLSTPEYSLNLGFTNGVLQPHPSFLHLRMRTTLIRKSTPLKGMHEKGTMQLASLAKPDPKREARGSGDKPIPTFVPQYVILYINEYSKHITTLYKCQYDFQLFRFKVQVAQFPCCTSGCLSF